MSNELKVFENTEFGKVRTILRSGKIWFVAKDVAIALGYANPQKAIRDHCKHTEELGVNETFTLTKQTGTALKVIPEGDVYRLISRSQLPNAQKFEEWLFDKVVPEIRETGSFGQAKLTMPKNFPEALERYAAELRRNEQLEAENEHYRFRLGESEEFHKVSEDPWIRANFKSRAFGHIGTIVKDLSEKMDLPIHETPHPVHGHVNVYSKDAISAFRIMCEHDPDYLANWRLDD